MKEIKGFTLIETILYISIISIIILGIYISIINIINYSDISISNRDYDNLIKNLHEK